MSIKKFYKKIFKRKFVTQFFCLDDDLYAGKENGGNRSGPAGVVCPGCRVPFNTGKQRRLLDSCGHERCYTCMFQTDQCPICTGNKIYFV